MNSKSGQYQPKEGPVAVTNYMLTKIFKNKEDKKILKQYISSAIGTSLSTDQKILAWDYLKNHKLPDRINLKYNYILPETIAIVGNSIQRKGIESGFSAKMSPKSIYELICKDNPNYYNPTIKQIEMYGYFYWNIIPENGENVSRADIATKIDELYTNINRGTNYKLNAEKNGIILDDDVADIIDNCQYSYVQDLGFYKRKISENDYRMVATPYYGVDTPDHYTMWTNITPESDVVDPLYTYNVQKKILMGAASIPEVVSAKGHLGPDEFDDYEGIREMIRLSIMNSLNKMHNDTEYNAFLYINGTALGVSKIARNYNIEPSRGEKLGRAAIERVIDNKRYTPGRLESDEELGKRLAENNK